MGVIFIVEDVFRMCVGLFVVVWWEFFFVSLVSIVVKFWWWEFFVLWLDMIIEGVGKLFIFFFDLFMFLKDIRWYRFESFDVLFLMFLEDIDVDRIVLLVVLVLLNVFVIVENKFGVLDDFDECSVFFLDGVGRGECFFFWVFFVLWLSEFELDFIVWCVVRCK